MVGLLSDGPRSPWSGVDIFRPLAHECSVDEGFGGHPLGGIVEKNKARLRRLHTKNLGVFSAPASKLNGKGKKEPPGSLHEASSLLKGHGLGCRQDGVDTIIPGAGQRYIGGDMGLNLS